MRLPDWQSRLAAILKEKQGSTFELGRNDCALFASDCIAAITGIDPATEFRGKYDSLLQGARLGKEHGAADLEALIDSITARLGFLEIKPAFAQRGDLGMYRDPAAGPALGVCGGSWFAFLTLADGLTYKTHGEIARAWRVG